MLSETFSKNMRILHTSSGRSVQDFSFEIGIEPALLLALESGQIDPTLTLVEQIADKLHISPYLLIFGTRVPLADLS